MNICTTHILDSVRRAVICGVMALGLAACGGSADPDNSDWAMHGLDAAEQRHSPLTQINADTVGQLGLDWYHDFDVRRGQEATPIVVDGVIYVTSAWSVVHAFDAKTGDKLWEYDPEVPGEWGVRGCCDVVNRGVAFAQGTVFFGTFDGRLIALNAKTGTPIWTVDTIIDRDKNYTITGAPRVVKGNVLIGNGGGEFGVRGYVTAYDLATGEQSWRFFTVPGDPNNPQENAIHETTKSSWQGEYWKQGGGGTVWDSMAYDAELDLLYIGVGNGSPWNPEIRSPGGGDNLFLSSIVALRPETGEYVWHFQTTPGDQWDFTATQHMILADLEIAGETRQVIMQAPKNGFFYVLDRQTGEFLSGKPYVPVKWAKGLDPKTGRPDIVPEAFYHKTGQPFIGAPGPMGGHNWHPMSFDPETGLVFIPAQELEFPYIADNDMITKKLAVNLGIDLQGAGLPDAQDIRDQVRKSLKGALVAWDPIAQKQLWRVDGAGPWNGGVLSTAGGLVFQGNRQGNLVAYRAQTGEKLWSFEAQTGIVAPPVTYSVDGEQYVAVMAGWGGILPLLLGELSHNDDGPQVNRSRLLVFKIGGQAALPEPYDVGGAKNIAPPRFGNAAQLDEGAGLYARFCAGCHGDTAVSGGVLPDLRYSLALSDTDVWHQIVRDGVLASQGMVSFSAELNDAQLNAIRAYITERAHRSGAVAIATAERTETKRKRNVK